ncbi:MAG TPA: thiol reductant ABC exporter subunit CydD [Propionibacteriaceae bacterium]|nr:thiol reductant ABC exporter subunit CydD [Propionibacteriaceae bacterium]
MVALAVVGVVASLLIIAQARLISDAVAHVFVTHRTDGVAGWAGLLALVFLGRAVLAWAGEVLAHRAAADVKSRLRHDLLAARLGRPHDAALPTGTLVTLVTEGLDDLDGYYAKYLPQVLLAATVPLIIAVTIAGQDVESAVIIAVTIPLIPVFMALIGWTTQAQVQRRLRVATRLANHFADLVTGLSTLQVFGRARAQLEGLRQSEGRHRAETMRTLRVTFLSSFVLELLATISVALVAVSVGFRVVFGEIDLRTALFILILAPEAYLPVRQVGVHFHDAADGMAAADAAFAVIEDAERAARSGTREVPADTTLVLDAVTHRYPDAPTDALAPLSLTLAPGEIVALAGPSGGGKSTALAVVAGFLRPTGGRVLVGGISLDDLDPDRWREALAWVGQVPGMIHGTIAENTALGSPGASASDIAAALRDAGAAGLDPGRQVGDDAEGLSAGERRRVGVARALLRLRSGGARLLILDEPTAGLDSDTEATVLHAVRAAGVSALVVSHRPAVLAMVDRVVDVGSAVPA